MRVHWGCASSAKLTQQKPPVVLPVDKQRPLLSRADKPRPFAVCRPQRFSRNRQDIIATQASSNAFSCTAYTEILDFKVRRKRLCERLLDLAEDCRPLSGLGPRQRRSRDGLQEKLHIESSVDCIRA